MTKRSIISWLREVGHMLAVHADLEKKIAEIKSVVVISRAMESTKQEATSEAELNNLTQRLGQIEAEILQRTNKSDIDKATELLQDIGVRLELAEKFETEYRERAAKFELAVALNEFQGETEEETVENRVAAQQWMNEPKIRFEESVKMADNLVPNVRRLLSV